jgi:hypothetical protein
MFLHIMNGVKSYDNYFVCKADAIGKVSFSSYQSTVTVHMLAYGIADDLVDEYMRMSEAACLVSMYKFYRVVVPSFEG